MTLICRPRTGLAGYNQDHYLPERIRCHSSSEAQPTQDWPDTIKITTFRNGLGVTARQRLNLQLNLPCDYPGFIRTVQQLSGNTSVPANTQSSDQMDTSVGNINPILASLEQRPSPQNSCGVEISYMDEI